MADEYRSASRLAWVAIFGVASAAMAHVTSVGAFGIVMRAFPDIEARAAAGDWLAMSAVVLVAWGALLSFGTMLLGGVAFLSWLYRVVKNTRLTVRIRGIPTPGVAVMVWFVPILGLFRPYTMLRTVYRANDAAGTELPKDWVRRMPWLMPVWWVSWVLHMVFIRLGSGSGEDLAHTYDQASFVGLPFTVVSALTAIAVVLSVQARQEAAHAADQPARLPPFEPPPHVQE